MDVDLSRVVSYCRKSPGEVKGVRLTTIALLGISSRIRSSVLRGSGLHRSKLSLLGCIRGRDDAFSVRQAGLVQVVRVGRSLGV